MSVCSNFFFKFVNFSGDFPPLTFLKFARISTNLKWLKFLAYNLIALKKLLISKKINFLTICNTLLPCFGNFFEEKISKTHQFYCPDMFYLIRKRVLSLDGCIFQSNIVLISAAISMLFHSDGLLVNWLILNWKYTSGFRLNSSNDLFIVLQLVNYPFLLIKETHARPPLMC